MEFLIIPQILFFDLINKKNPSKMVVYKLICPKWHFGQVGQGAERTQKIYIIDFSSWKSHVFLYWVDVNIKCLITNLVHRQNQTFAKRMKIKLVAIGENPKKVLNYNQFWMDSISPNQNQWLATSKHHTTKLLNFD